MFISNFAISRVANPMIVDLSNRSLGFFVLYNNTFSGNICHSFKVTLVATFLALSTLLAILASCIFLCPQFVYQNLRYSYV